MRLALISVLAAAVLFGVLVSGCNRNRAEVLPAAVHHEPPPERRIDRGRQIPQRRQLRPLQPPRMQVYVLAGDLAQYEPLPEPVPVELPPPPPTPALTIARTRLQPPSPLFSAPIPELDIRYVRERSDRLNT